MRGVEKFKRQSKNKYSEQSGENQINNSKALGVMALIALLFVFQVVTFVIGKINKKQPQSPGVVEAVKGVESEQKKDTLIYFNPNTVTLDTLQMLGFTRRQAQTILNYRTKGGVFRVKRDFAKMYVVDSAKYRQLSGYILLPDDFPPKAPAKNAQKISNKQNKFVKKEKPDSLPENNKVRKYKTALDTFVYGAKVKRTYKRREKIDLNKADSAQLVSLYGIGPYFAKKILWYRESLGGSFADTRQLMEIDRFTPDKFSAIEQNIVVKEEDIIKFSFWEVDEAFLKKHPYIGAYTARGVLLFLGQNAQQMKGLSGRELLEKMVQERVITQNIAQRLEKYVK